MAGNPWDYSLLHGPNTWPKTFPEAAGKRQSPINIEPDKVQHDPSLEKTPLCANYELEDDYKLANTGMSVQISKTSVVRGVQLHGGPLSHNYRLAQFHFHWGKGDSAGSEHLIDGASFPAELHLVHWNADLCSSFADAVSKENGLAVLGVFLRLGEESEALKPLANLLPRAQNKGDAVLIEEGFNPGTLLPKSRHYWTYYGSLTTPPCSESVTWVVFKEAISVSPQQLEKFRKLRGSPCWERSGGCIVDNFRHVNPLNGRVVKSASA